MWDCLMNVALSDQEDRHIWKLDASGCHSSKSAYRAYFNGSMTFEPWHHIWKTWEPQKCKLFLWLAVKNRYWTADRLARTGLEHPNNLLSSLTLCDQEEENVQHLLTTCVVARQVWFHILNPLNLATVAPRIAEKCFAEWWRRTMKKVTNERRKGVNSLIILTAWSIWIHRNACVFEGVAPSVSSIMRKIKDEHGLWCTAGAKRLEGLGLGGGLLN